MSEDLLDKNTDDIEKVREHPTGKYRGHLMGATYSKNEKGTNIIDLEFTLDEPLDGQDMTGVETARKLRHRIFLSEANQKYVVSDLEKAGVPIAGKSIKQALEEAETSRVEAGVIVENERFLKVKWFRILEAA